RFLLASVSSISYRHHSVATHQKCCRFGGVTNRSRDLTSSLRTAPHFISIAEHSMKHWRSRRAMRAPISDLAVRRGSSLNRRAATLCNYRRGSGFDPGWGFLPPVASEEALAFRTCVATSTTISRSLRVFRLAGRSSTGEL